MYWLRAHSLYIKNLGTKIGGNPCAAVLNRVVSATHPFPRGPNGRASTLTGKTPTVGHFAVGK